MLLKTFCTADGTYEKKLHKVNLSMTEKSSTWEDICEITKKIYNILNMFFKQKIQCKEFNKTFVGQLC